MKKTVRIFIAIELSGDARKEISRILGELGNTRVKIRWVEPKFIHLTLKFLGPVEEDKLPMIVETLKRKLAGVPAFDLKLGEIGAFPGWKHAKVIWIGTASGSEIVNSLASILDISLSEKGFSREVRDFKPHFTVGRVNESQGLSELGRIASNIVIRPTVVRVSEITVFRSDFTPEGGIYTPIAKIPLV